MSLFLKKNMKFKKKYLFIFYLSLLLQIPVHAYAGPGAAIGAIIVAITVIFAFIASLIIGIYEMFKKFFLNRTKKKHINKKSDEKLNKR